MANPLDGKLEVKGLAELERTLARLPESISRIIAEGGVRAGLTVIQEAAQENAPQRTGRLRKDIKVKVGSNIDAKRAYKEPLAVDGSVYVSKRSASVARWNEFGTAPHAINAHGTTLDINGEPVGKTVQHPGQPARPFMRPAFDNNKNEALKAMADNMRENLPKAAEDAKR